MSNIQIDDLNIVYEVLSGSHAYGLATEFADEDVRGVFMPTSRQLLGFGYKETRVGQPDVQYHSLKKFVQLCLKANPSLLAWLWVKDEFVTKTSPVGNALRENRHRFLSKLVYKTFGGYATSQLRKMQKSYGFDKGYALHGERNAEKDPYSAAARYDTKNSMHLIRLLRCGAELLATGEYRVFRDYDRDLLLAIRHGEWAMDEVLYEAQSWFKEMDVSLERSRLPEKPDRKWAERFLRMAHYDQIVMASGT